jgi:glycosyltransferase involved in cell wall biosynthesis
VTPPAPSQHAVPPGIRVLSVGNMYPPHHLGGAELVWRSNVHHLRAGGHRVRVLTTDWRAEAPDPAIPEDEDIHRLLRWYWADHGFPRLGPIERLRIERHNRRVLVDQVREFEPDVLAWWSMGGMSVALIEWGRRLGVPAIGVVHDDWLVYGPRVDGWRRMCHRLGPPGRALAAVAGLPATTDFRGVRRWVFNSEVSRAHAAAAGVAVEDSLVVHPGVEEARFRPGPERRWSGRLLHLGRIDPRKGIEVAVRALARLPGAELTVVGQGDPRYLDRLRSVAGADAVADRVRFELVDRDRVPDLFARFDALLFPALWEEPWGLVPLEAMASGVPVVATGTGGSGEYLRDGENCLVYSPREDPAALADAVRRLASDERLRRRLRENGLETASRFSQRAFDETITAVLQEVAR